MTLCRFIAMDSVGDVYEQLMLDDPALCLFFTPLVMIVAIAVMNFVTAVLVECALENAEADKDDLIAERKRRVREAAPVARELFKVLDQDGSGIVTIEEVRDVLTNGVVKIPASLRRLMQAEDAVELFEVCDDGDGEMDEAEFVEGILKAALHDGHGELFAMNKMLRSQKHQLRRLEQFLVRGRSVSGAAGLLGSAALHNG